MTEGQCHQPETQTLKNMPGQDVETSARLARRALLGALMRSASKAVFRLYRRALSQVLTQMYRRAIERKGGCTPCNHESYGPS